MAKSPRQDALQLHLFGHMHDSNLSNIAAGGAGSRLYLQTRSLFGLEHWEDQEKHSLGYSFGILSFDFVAGTATVRLWPRKAEKRQAGHYHLVADSPRLSI